MWRHTLYHVSNEMIYTEYYRFTWMHLHKLNENTKTSLVHLIILVQRLNIYTKLFCVDYRNLLTEHMIFSITVSKATQLLLHGNTWQGQIEAEQSLLRVEKSGQDALMFDLPHTKDT